MANKKITDLMSGTPVRDSLLESAIDINGTLDSRKVKAGAVADLASANVAAAYDSATTYAIGQYCLYEGDIYRCIAITTGAFDSTAWTQIVVTGEFRRVVELTSAQYTALSSAEKNNGTLYVLTDEETTAADIPYSSGVSVADMLDITDITSTYCTTATGVTLEANDSSVYKQGKHIWGNLQFVIPSTTSQQVIATITSGFQPSKTIIGYAGYSGSKWSVDTIGSLYVGANKNIACTVSVSGKTYVNIVIDYLTN